MTTKEEFIASSEKHAGEEDLSLNQNEKIVEGITNAILRREQQEGELYCPCRKTTGNKEEDKKIICPCIYHLDEVKQDGHCHCNLFVRKE